MLLINLQVPAPPFPSPNYLTFKKISKLFIPPQHIKPMLSTVKLKDFSAHNYRLFAMKPGSFHCHLQIQGTGRKSGSLGRADRIKHTASARDLLKDCSFKP